LTCPLHALAVQRSLQTSRCSQLQVRYIHTAAPHSPYNLQWVGTFPLKVPHPVGIWMCMVPWDDQNLQPSHLALSSAILHSS